ncbi:YkvA family protein [Halomonas sp. GXIMD04776]|uniref:YkvA family protein n=1 Tax=Halomonas sp. GXIMD04776 TaxID=3415605 RepID=UPI003CB78FB0
MSLLKPWSFFSRLKHRTGALSRMGRALRLFAPMCADVIKGRYRPVPWSAFMWMALAFVYLISPLDLIPEALLLIGMVDDVVIVGWMLHKVDGSLEDYRRWKGVDADPPMQNPG